MKRLLPLLCLLFLLLLPAAAFADYGALSQGVESAGGMLPSLFANPVACDVTAGTCGFLAIAETIIGRFRPLLTIIATLIIVIEGFRMVIAQEDDAVQKIRPVISAIVAGLVMVWLVDPFVQAFYGSTGEVARGAMAAGAGIFSGQIAGLINWVLVIVAALAVIIMIAVALKALGEAAKEDGIAEMRRTAFTVVAGLLLIGFRLIISNAIVNHPESPLPLLAPVVVVISYLMGFLALAATIVVIYAGIQMVLTLGKEEQAQKAKALLLRALIGAIVIFASLAIVNFIIVPGVQ